MADTLLSPPPTGLDVVQPTLACILEQAIDIAKGAGEILRDGFIQFVAQRAPIHAHFKSSVFDPVTEFDYHSERFIVSALRQAFPDHHVVSEEGGAYQASDRGHERLTFEWQVDPVDGTVNFAHGFPAFAVSIGLLVNGWPALGVVYNPMTDELFSAAHQMGAYLNGRPIRVSETNALEAALFSTGFPYDAHVSDENNFPQFIAFEKRSQGVRRIGSAALDLCMVACGRIDGCWELKIKPHDIAAGAVIVREAGGTVTDFAGEGQMFARQQVVASNGKLHQAMLDVIKQSVSEPMR